MIVCQFTEGEIYSYENCPQSAWLQFKGDVIKGHDWNVAAIAFTRGNTTFTRLTSVPSGASDSF